MLPDKWVWKEIQFYQWGRTELQPYQFREISQYQWINVPLSVSLPSRTTIPFKIQQYITFQDIAKNGLSLKYCFNPSDITSILDIMNSIDNIQIIDDEKIINILKKIFKNGYTLGDIMMSGYSPDKIKSLYSCQALLNNNALLVNIEKVGYTLKEMKNAFIKFMQHHH